MSRSYVVIECTPGCLPENDEPLRTTDYAEAVAEVNRIARELGEQGWCVTPASRRYGRDRLYAMYAVRMNAVAPDLGRLIAVELDAAEGR